MKEVWKCYTTVSVMVRTLLMNSIYTIKKKKKAKQQLPWCSGLSMVLYPALFVNTRAHLQILHHTLQQQKVSLGWGQEMTG